MRIGGFFIILPVLNKHPMGGVMRFIFILFVCSIFTFSANLVAEDNLRDSGENRHDFSDLSKNSQTADMLATKFVDFDAPPEALSMIDPVYPEKARKLGIEAELYVRALVDSEGKVAQAEIIKIEASKKNLGFEKSALKAAHHATYKPAQKDGKPVATWIAYAVKFKLKDSEKSE